MSDHDLEQRVIKLEYVTEGHQEELTELKDTSAELRQTLHGIQTTLMQIKWIAIGAGIMYFADSFGVTELIKLVTM